MLKQCISIDSAKNLYAKPSQIQINDINNVIHKSISSAVNVSIHQQHNGIESGSVAQKPFALQIIDKKSFNSNECANNRIDHCQSLQFRHCTEKIGHRSSSICQCTNNVTKCCYRNAIKFSYIVYDMDTCAVNKLVSLLGCNLENFVRKMGEIDHGSVRCLLNNGMMTKCASITGSYCGIEMSTKCSSMSLSCASHIHQRVIGSGCVDANNLLKHCEHDDRIYGRIYIGPSMKAAGWFIDGILTVCNEQSTLPTLPPLLFSFKSRYTEDVAVAIVVAHGHHSDVSFLNDNYFIENRMRLSNTNAFINHKKSNANVDQIIFTSEHNNNRSAIDRVKYYGYTQNSKNIRNNDNLASVNMNNSQNDIDAATAMPKSHVSNVLPQTFEVNAISATQKTSKRFEIIRCTSYLVDAKKFLSALFLSLVFFCNLLPMSCAECDQTFVSRPGGPQNGTFAAPIINNMSNHSRQCLYIFLAGPGQRVEITFTSFNLRGSPPDGAAVGEIPSCGAEYMDIYSEVQSSDPADLINSPFGGRYCGPNLPRRRISLYRAIALSFFTNKNATSADLFSGRYSFINASIFEIGTPVTGSPCSFTITPHKNKSDVFISPTYPGTYPKDLSCTYHFIGECNQRVRLEFRDFDLLSGGPHCPFDYVKVYDGPDNSSDLIGTYCGQQRNLVLYSNESSLLVHFFTLRRTASTQNRGFKGIYEFSESFVKLDFIRENKGIHIRGSECDQKILSKRESTGLVYSPNYPYPYLPKTVCRYFIYGLQDAQHLERVRLEFQMFEIQKVTEHKDKDKESNCTDGYLKVFLKGQETQDAYDKFDYELCGQEIPHTVVSDGPRLAMVFSSGELQARGFKAKYTFETEYKIPGTAAPDGSCGFTYRSTSRKKGEFNSPRFPSKYISDTNCTYTFIPTPNEQVTIVFDHFKVKADNANVTNGGAYGVTACSEDWLEIYILFRDGNDRFIGRYCGSTSPGPVESPRLAVGIRIHLHTDAENVSSGFKGRYVFEVAKSDTGDCGGNSISGQESDVIMSPNYPGKYDGPGKGLASRACNWYINARPGYRVSMNFEFFSVEGDPPSRGCPAAALRIWTAPDSEQAPTELCGDKSPSENWHYISQGTQARINFVTTDKTIGAQGFRIVWTEVQDTTQLVGPPSSIVNHCEPISLFHCPISSYCISNKLRCDGMKNCGPDDESDEMNCPTEVTKDESEILIISSLAASSFLICLVCTIYHRRKRRKHHHRQLGLHRSGGHYDSTTSATGLGSSRRHLQSGNSLSGSLHYGINSDDDILPIPQPPLPPTSVPPHLNHLITNCTEDPMHGMDDDDDEEDTDLDSELPSMSMHINHQHHSSKFAIRNIETH